MEQQEFAFQKLIKMSPEELRKTVHKKRHHKRKIRKNWSKDELINFLRDKNIKSSYELEKNYKDPKFYDIVKHFGSWENAVKEVFGIKKPIDILKNVRVIDAGYIIKLFVGANIKTTRQYWRGRHLRSDLFPTWHQIIKYFGDWTGVTKAMGMYSIETQLEQYMKLRERLFRHPTKLECTQAGITLDLAIWAFGSKKELNRIADLLIDLRYAYLKKKLFKS